MVAAANSANDTLGSGSTLDLHHTHVPLRSQLSAFGGMKFYSGLAFSQLFVSIIASAADPRFGHIYLYDPSSPRPDQTADRLVDPKTARLIFARRLGLSRYHTINDASAVEIRQINTFGGDHSSLFGDDTKESRPRSLILVEGVNEAKGMLLR